MAFRAGMSETFDGQEGSGCTSLGTGRRTKDSE